MAGFPDRERVRTLQQTPVSEKKAFDSDTPEMAEHPAFSPAKLVCSALT